MKVLKPPQSGSIQGVTASRNRFGQYERTRSIPVNPNSDPQGDARARMSASSQAWRAITADQRAGWESLGAQMIRSDSLGQSYSLQGSQAHASVNNVRQVCGLALVSDAPALTSPTALETVTVTLTDAAFSIAYTATPLSAAHYLLIFASPQRSSGRMYEGDYRLIAVTAAAAASPHNLLAAYTSRCGEPVVGNRIFLSLVVATLGFEAGPFRLSQVVSA